MMAAVFGLDRIVLVLIPGRVVTEMTAPSP